MRLVLVCSGCEHIAPLPEQTGTYKCSKCGARIELTYFRGPDAWAQWQRRERQRIFSRIEVGELPRIELRPVEAAIEQSRPAN